MSMAAIQQLGEHNQRVQRDLRIALAAMAPVAQAFARASQQCWDILYSRYLAAGAPFGETPEGCLQYYRHVAEGHKLLMAQREEAADQRMREYIRAHFAQSGTPGTARELPTGN
jgi:hypothetical protein